MGFFARQIKKKKKNGEHSSSERVYIYFESYKNGKQLQEIINPSSTKFHHFGFSRDMTLEQARARCKQLNGQAKVEKKQKLKEKRILDRVDSDKNIAKLYVPYEIDSEFIARLEKRYFGNQRRLTDVMKLWNVAKVIINELRKDWKQFHDGEDFHNYFRDRKLSPDYIKKLIWITNEWGKFNAAIVSRYYSPLPKLPDTKKNEIFIARKEIKGIKRAAATITFNSLMAAKTSFENHKLKPQFNWLFIAFVFGLRPSEVDWLKNQNIHNLIVWDNTNKCDVLKIYQTKLTSIADDDRWKVIPIFLKEQEDAIKILKLGPSEYKRPLNKTIRPLLKNDNIQVYTPRKSFTDWMLSKGCQLEDISAWLGHQSIEMTWKKYKNKKMFNLPKAG